MKDVDCQDDFLSCRPTMQEGNEKKSHLGYGKEKREETWRSIIVHRIFEAKKRDGQDDLLYDLPIDPYVNRR